MKRLFPLERKYNITNQMMIIWGRGKNYCFLNNTFNAKCFATFSLQLHIKRNFNIMLVHRFQELLTHWHSVTFIKIWIFHATVTCQKERKSDLRGADHLDQYILINFFIISAFLIWKVDKGSTVYRTKSRVLMFPLNFYSILLR